MSEISHECADCQTSKLLGRSLQRKLDVGHTDDVFEREADRIADDVMRASEPAPPVRARSGSGAGLREVPPIVHDVLASTGQQLDSALRAYFEPRFGYDFSRVRVHADTRAAASARSVNATAYTVGRDVVFNRGQYSTRPSASQSHLLAHELAHVVQQHSSGPRLSRKPAPKGADYSGLLGTLEDPDPSTALSRAVAALESVREGDVNQYFVELDGYSIELNEFQFQNWMGNVRAVLMSAPRNLRDRLNEVEGLYKRTLEVNAKYSDYAAGSAIAALGGVAGEFLYQAASYYYGTEKPGDELTQAFSAATAALDEADEALTAKAYGRMLDSLARAEPAIEEASRLVDKYREDLGAQAESAAQAATTVRQVSIGVLIGLGSVIAAPVLAPEVVGGAVIGGGVTIVGGASTGALVEAHVNLGEQAIRGEGVDKGELGAAAWKGAEIGGPASAGGVVGLGIGGLVGEATSIPGALWRGGLTGFGSGSASSSLQATMEGKSAGEIGSATFWGGLESSIGGMAGGLGNRFSLGEGIRARLAITGLSEASGNVLGAAVVGKSPQEMLLSGGLGVVTGTAMEFGATDAAMKSVESDVQTKMTTGAVPRSTRAEQETRLQAAYSDLEVLARARRSQLPPDFDLARFHDTLLRVFEVLGNEKNLAAAAAQLEETRRLDIRGSKGRTAGDIYDEAARQLFRRLNQNPQQEFIEIRWVADSDPSGKLTLTKGKTQMSFEGETIDVQPAPVGTDDDGTIVIVGPGGVKQGFRAKRGFVDPQKVFPEKVIEPGLPFFDYAALDLSPTGKGEHGAITHMIQDVALINAGIDPVQFRKDLGAIQVAFPDWKEGGLGRVWGLGTGLWNVTYDVDPDSWGAPEHFWEQAMKPTLGIKAREL